MITDLQLVSNNDDYVTLDFILASRPAGVPEPNTLAILSTALIGLGLVLRRRLASPVGPRAAVGALSGGLSAAPRQRSGHRRALTVKLGRVFEGMTNPHHTGLVERLPGDLKGER